MYANLLGARVGKADVDSGLLVHGNRFIPVADAIATVNDAGTMWSIALVNRHPSEEMDCTAKLKDAPLSGSFHATVLVGDSPDAYNDIEHPNRVTPEERRLTFKNGTVKLPPHSLTIVEVPVTKVLRGKTKADSADRIPIHARQ
jgi:alpha-N-arabinofuranosidase